jgi:transglutaminase-like putative cysteine protease
MKTSKRAFIQTTSGLSAALVAGLRSGNTMAATSNDEQAVPTPQNLQSTELIEASNPKIIALAKEITRSAQSNRAAAVLIHDWVRDQIAFGFPAGFYETTATQSLDAKVGYCNTKVSLFNALLRARSIATRIRMVDLSAQVLQGLLDPGTPYVDHALTEVYLDGRWIKVDSYVADKPLAVVAAKRLANTTIKAGFGIHVDGKSDWDGRTDNFIQYMNNETIPNYVLKDHGLFVDVADFYKKAHNPRNRKTLLSGLGIRFGAASINRRIEQIRKEAI